MSMYSNGSTGGNPKVRKKLAMRTMLFTIFTICAVVCLSACESVPKEKTEDEILAEIQAQDNYFGDYNLQVTSFSISKRQTNADEKTDYVWCEVSAANNDFSYLAEYQIVYGLYNEGWMLDYCSMDSSSIKVTRYPTEYDAFAILRERNPNAEKIITVETTMIESPITDTSITFPCRVLWRTEYNDLWHLDYAITFEFTPESGWKALIDSYVMWTD